MSDKDGGPAFPMMYEGLPGEKCEHGMTLRDYFAAAAMQGCLAQAAGTDVTKTMPEDISLVAFAIADAMLKERTK